ncbi:pyridoxal phosphate-dependent aminotransferase [Luteimonas sp. Y-2-2-4F]|nr:pyridoxal phosphate-dependent aminotransferase [Luteimonas sp. Y-2-2-4F]MCD9030157.1 pyridoxal phosphate-dependent aminotransferase [Luteimonas sp. Y-2-2-4F]
MPLSRRSFLRWTGSGLAAAAALPAPAAAEPAPAAAGPALLNFNECPHGPSEAARRAVAEILPRSGRYLFGLRQELEAAFAQRHGVPQERVAAFAGSSDPLARAGLAFTSPDASLVLPVPTFDAVAETAATRGANVHAVPLRPDGAHDVEAMAAADARAGLLYVCNPNNPSATTTPRAALEWLLAHKPPGAVVLADEAYIEYSDEPSLLELAARRDDLVVLRTFSKLYGMAGLRLGLAAGAPALLQRLAAQGGNPLPVTALAAGLASLREPGLVERRKADNARLRDEAIARLEREGHRTLPSAANFFMVETDRDGRAFADAMARHGVVIGRAWPQWPRRVRVTVGTDEDMRRFHAAFAATMAERAG